MLLGDMREVERGLREKPELHLALGGDVCLQANEERTAQLPHLPGYAAGFLLQLWKSNSSCRAICQQTAPSCPPSSKVTSDEDTSTEVTPLPSKTHLQ